MAPPPAGPWNPKPEVVYDSGEVRWGAGRGRRLMVGAERRRGPMVSRTGRLTLVAVGLLLAACVPSARSGGTSGPPGSARIGATANTGLPTASAQLTPEIEVAAIAPVVIGDWTALPPGCQPDEVARLVARFFAAVNSGNGAQIGQVYAIAAGPAGSRPQGWYSVSWSPAGQEPRQFAGYTQDDLLTYFQARHVQHEGLRLVSLHVRAPTWHGGVDVTYTLGRSAHDLGGERAYGGKGAINCARQQIFVWSMTDVDQPPLPDPAAPRGSSLLSTGRMGASSPSWTPCRGSSPPVSGGPRCRRFRN